MSIWTVYVTVLQTINKRANIASFTAILGILCTCKHKLQFGRYCNESQVMLT